MRAIMAERSVVEGVVPDPTAARLCSGLAELVAEAGREKAELALWNRTLSQQSADAFVNLDLCDFEDVRLQGAGVEVLVTLESKLNSLNWSRLVVEQVVRAIIEASAFWSPHYALRLESVDDDACRKFHKDRTDIRLITTYRGAGTQWIDIASSESEPLIQGLATFDIGAFLGRRDGRVQRVFHRSPPIQPSDISRLVLVLDIERPGWVSHSLKGAVQRIT